MLNTLSLVQLTSEFAGDTSSIIALVLGGVALVIALIAYSIARRGSAGQTNEPVMAVAAASAGANVGSSQPASDDKQLVAVITAAIAAILADEASAGVAMVGAGAAGAASVSGAAGAAGAARSVGTGSGPYAGFVVRRIRRV